MGIFVLTKRSNGEYQFHLKAGNGEIILSSNGYSSQEAALNGIKSVMSNGSRLDRYESKLSVDDRCYFTLKASNGQVIGTSQMYESDKGRDNGIQSVMKNVVGARIDNLISPDLPNTSIAQFVKEKRKQIGLTQEELAFKAGVGLRFIRELEGGEKSTLRIDKVNQVLKLFGHTLGPVLMNKNA